MFNQSIGVRGVSDIINSQGKKMIVVATLPAGVDVCITTKEQLDEFFKSNPCASLKFLETNDERAKDAANG